MGMGLFRRGRTEDARTPDVGLAWHGEGAPKLVMSLVQALVREYERVLGNPDFTIKRAEYSLWTAVSSAALWHNQAMKLALRAVPRAEIHLAEPAFQSAINRALDLFAERFGIQGGLVSAWGTVQLFNQRTQSQWVRKERGFWWDDLPLFYACLLTPRDADAVPGILLAEDGEFSFTPHADHLAEFAFVSDEVDSAEIGDGAGGTLRFKAEVPVVSAEFAAGVPPVTPALRRAGLLKHDLNRVLGEVLDEAVQNGTVDAATAQETRRRGVPRGEVGWAGRLVLTRPSGGLLYSESGSFTSRIVHQDHYVVIT
jgi:hypothetical protein